MKNSKTFWFLFLWTVLLLTSALVPRSAQAANLTREELGLTAQEIAYLEAHPHMRVAAPVGAAPITAFDERGEFVGIARNVMDHMARELGLTFTYVSSNTTEDLQRQAAQGEIDLMALPENYAQQLFPQVPLTRSYLSADTVLFYRDDLRPNDLDKKICAVVKGASAPSGIPEARILYCETRLDAVEKVNNGQADYGYGNGFSITYYVAQQGFQHVLTLPVSDDTRHYCVGVLDGDPLMLSALNKAIDTLDTRTMQTLVLEACVLPDTPITLGEAVRQLALPLVILLAVLLAGVLAVAWYIHRANRELKLQNTRLLTLSEVSGDLLFEYDIKLDHLRIFKQFREAFQIPLKSAPYSKADIAEIVDLDSVVSRRITGEELALPQDRYYKATYSYLRGGGDTPVYLVGKLVDVSLEKARLEDLSAKAKTDGLTNLLNSAEARVRVRKELAQLSPGRTDALLILDVDKFKSINDNFGHYTGDQVLVQMADLLRRSFRSHDIVGRLGGDEFIAYLLDIGETDNLSQLCRSIVDRLQVRLEKDGLCETTSVSVGAYLVTCPEPFDLVYQRADKALYQAKLNGGKQFRVYGQDL